MRWLLTLLQPVKMDEHVLCPTDGKRRYNDGAPARSGTRDDLGERIFGVPRLVLAIAVGRFQNKIVRAFDDRRVVERETIRPSEITGEEQRAARVFELDHRCSEDVASVEETRFESSRDCHPLVE
jgi:hypothetical protein